MIGSITDPRKHGHGAQAFAAIPHIKRFTSVEVAFTPECASPAQPLFPGAKSSVSQKVANSAPQILLDPYPMTIARNRRTSVIDKSALLLGPRDISRYM